MYVIGTAGHVDHGKSTLVFALTGVDPDRLREEKERGLTIELGFAPLRLPSGDEVSIVDVPGHERFIKNMLAGVGGIDLALLVVAADEGVMPQTREHLAIIDLLGIEHGVVALTKADLAEPDMLELVEADVRETLAGTTLAGAPIVRCSGVTRAGLDDLLSALQEQLARTPRKRDIGRPRLPIDRAFTMAGFGTVVTGTLIDGTLRAGEEVEVLPASLRARIRGLQNHGIAVDTALPGTRTAVNLAGPAVDDLRRGMVLARPGTLRPTSSVDVRLRIVPYLGRPVRHNLAVTVHLGAAEAPGKLLLLDSDALGPGEFGWAQLRLDEPVVAVRGDRFIVRDPNDTLGGGRIVDTDVRRHRRFHEPIMAALEALDRGSPEELLLMTVARLEPVALGDAAKAAGLDIAGARAHAGELAAAGRLVVLGGLIDTALLYAAEGFAALGGRISEALAAYHRAAPLRPGMPREELRKRTGLAPRAFDQAIAALASRDVVRDGGALVALPGHTPALSPDEQSRADAYLAALAANPYAPPTDSAPPPDTIEFLEASGAVVRAGDVVFAAESYAEMAEKVTAHIRQHGSVTLGQVRDMFGTSRRYAQALLEHMDAQRITRRVGDERVLRN